MKAHIIEKRFRVRDQILSAAKRQQITDLCQDGYCEVDFSEDDENMPVAFLTIKSTEKRVQMVQDQLLDSDIFQEADISVPQWWERGQYIDPKQVKGDNPPKFFLDESTPEYHDVADKFKKSSPNLKIHNIIRVQNIHRWKRYTQFKEEVQLRNGGSANEQQLFHGCASEVTSGIITNGFDRGYNGKNATAFGKGTYFAVQSSYSSSPTYSVPDNNNIQRMFLARVVVGESVQGHSSYRTAPFNKDRFGDDTVIRYETCYADQASFRIYVTWQDEQAYPEYLIEFSQS